MEQIYPVFIMRMLKQFLKIKYIIVLGGATV